MGKIEFNKEKVSKFIIKQVKDIIIIAIISLIGTPIMLMFMSWFFMHFFGYTLV